MKFGVGVDYSLKALLFLAARFEAARPLTVEEIAASEDLPEDYLRRLLAELKRGGIVVSRKGPSGSYALARHPSKITMAEVVSIIEGENLGVNASSRRAEAGAIPDVWRRVGEAVTEILRRQSLESLLKRRKAALMFQI